MDEQSMGHQQRRDTPMLIGSYESTEQALFSSFKAAASSVTTLYKDSLRQNRRAYAAGYEQCLQDLYGFMTSHPGGNMNCDQGGAIPIQDLLNFARSKTAELQTEIGRTVDEQNATPSAHLNPSPSSTTPTQTPLETGELQPKSENTFSAPPQQFNPNVDGHPTPPTLHSTPPQHLPFAFQPTGQNTPVPLDQTQYAHHHSHAGLPAYDNVNQNHKRRFTPPDVQFLGRTFSLPNTFGTAMSIDSHHEPPVKRNRRGKEDGP